MNEIDLPKKKEVVEESNEPLSFKELVQEVFKFLTHNDIIDIIVFIFQLLILALVIIVFKFPIELVIDLGPKLFNVLGDGKIIGTLVTIWTLVFNVIYAALGIYAYIKICEVRFVNLNKKK